MSSIAIVVVIVIIVVCEAAIIVAAAEFQIISVEQRSEALGQVEVIEGQKAETRHSAARYFPRRAFFSYSFFYCPSRV